MIFEALYGFGQNFSLLISRDNRIIKIKDHDETLFIDALGKTKLSQNKKNYSKIRFRKILATGSDNTERFGLVRCTSDHDDKIPENIVDLIKRGIQYKINLGPLGDEKDSFDFEVSLFYILKKNSDKTVYLGLIEKPDDNPKIKKDENIIAVLDLLGFSDIMSKNSLVELEDKFNQLLFTMAMSDFLANDVLLFDMDGEMNDINFDESMSSISYEVISDTVIIYLKNKTDNPLEKLCTSVANFINGAIANGWLFRGAIDVGTFRVMHNKNVFLGKVLINAYKLEKKQNWCGCTLSDEVLKRFKDESEELQEKGLIVKYKIPFKNETKPYSNYTKDSMAINWCYFAGSITNSDLQLKTLESMLKKAPNNKAKYKIKATIKFIGEMKKRKLVEVGHHTKHAILPKWMINE